MEIRREVQNNPYTFRVDRYPWDWLQADDDKVVLFGKLLNPQSARMSAYLYAKRHGFKVSVVMDVEKWEIMIIRRAAPPRPPKPVAAVA